MHTQERMRVDSLELYDTDGRTPVFEQPHTVALNLEAGESIPEHTHPDSQILFAVFEGSLALSVGPETRTLTAGEVATFAGDHDIAVEAHEDSRALVVFGE